MRNIFLSFSVRLQYYGINLFEHFYVEDHARMQPMKFHQNAHDTLPLQVQALYTHDTLPLQVVGSKLKCSRELSCGIKEGCRNGACRTTSVKAPRN